MQSNYESLVPLPITWQNSGKDVFVTGDFNGFSLLPLTGDAEKFVIV